MACPPSGCLYFDTLDYDGGSITNIDWVDNQCIVWIFFTAQSWLHNFSRLSIVTESSAMVDFSTALSALLGLDSNQYDCDLHRYLKQSDRLDCGNNMSDGVGNLGNSGRIMLWIYLRYDNAQ